MNYKYIKNTCLCLCAILLEVAFYSCGMRDVNGKLDGRWQLMEIDYYNADEIEFPEYTYFDYQQKLMQLTRTQGDEYNNKKVWARFNHIEDSLHIKAVSDDITEKIEPKMMLPYGMQDTIQNFKIEMLTNKKMVLNSNYARLRFRKF